MGFMGMFKSKPKEDASKAATPTASTAAASTPASSNANNATNASKPATTPAAKAAAPKAAASAAVTPATAASNYLNHCKSLFKSIDADGNGTLDVSELGAGFMRLGLKCGNPKTLMEEYDTDRSGGLDELEFIAMVAKLMGVRKVLGIT